MKTTEEHRIILKKIADLALSNGLKNSGVKIEDIFNNPDLTKEDAAKFIFSCHEGFKEAQILIITELQEYQEELASLKVKLKDSRRKRLKDVEKEIIIQQEIIENRISSFSHIMDTIVWQLTGGQIATARRLYIQEKGSKSLDNSNISHAIKVANKINEKPENLAIISDITNFVQIGDLLVLHNGIVGIMELKEGRINDQIAEFLSTLEANNQTIEDVNLDEKFDKDTAKQIKRVVRQKTRMKQVVSIINEDKGIDPVSGSNINIGTPTIITEYYYEDLNSLRENLESKNWSYGLVERCLHIGMYKDEGILMAPIAIKSLLEEETKNYLITDWMSIISNLSEPIFAKPFPPDFIIDVITGKIKIIIGLNLDLMIELFNILGLKTSWMTTKETARIKQQGVKGIIEKNNRGISMETSNGEKMIMFGGTISKILYDNIKPSSIALSLLNMYGEVDDEEKTTDNTV